jgi:hypothetical protein
MLAEGSDDTPPLSLRDDTRERGVLAQLDGVGLGRREQGEDCDWPIVDGPSPRLEIRPRTWMEARHPGQIPATVPENTVGIANQMSCDGVVKPPRQALLSPPRFPLGQFHQERAQGGSWYSTMRADRDMVETTRFAEVHDVLAGGSEDPCRLAGCEHVHALQHTPKHQKRNMSPTH